MFRSRESGRLVVLIRDSKLHLEEFTKNVIVLILTEKVSPDDNRVTFQCVIYALPSFTRREPGHPFHKRHRLDSHLIIIFHRPDANRQNRRAVLLLYPAEIRKISMQFYNPVQSLKRLAQSCKCR